MSKEAVFFDLNGVLLELSVRDFCKEFWHYTNKWRLIFHFLNPLVALKAIKLAWAEPVVEHAIIKLIKQFPHLMQHKAYMLNAISCQNIKAGAPALIKFIQHHHIQLFALTNIGEESIALLQKRHPLFFSNFIEIYHTTKADNYVAKPEKSFFLNHLPKAEVEFNQIIFIDDNNKNIQVARELGLYTIHCKSIPQLHKEVSLLLDFF